MHIWTVDMCASVASGLKSAVIQLGNFIIA